MAEHERAFEALSEAVLDVARETDLEAVLHKLVHTVRDLIGARYAALGIPDGQGGFDRFLTSGMSDELIERSAPCLARTVCSPRSSRTPPPTEPTTSGTMHASSGGRVTIRR